MVLAVLPLALGLVTATAVATVYTYLWDGGGSTDDWDVWQNWDFDCPLPPPQQCNYTSYPDDTEDNAIFLINGSLTVQLTTESIRTLQVGAASGATNASLTFESQDSANTVTCTQFKVKGPLHENGNFTEFKVRDGAKIQTN